MSTFAFASNILTSARRSTLASLGLLLPAAALAQAPTISSMTPSMAAPGTTITIIGTNLTSFTSVLLNGLAVRATAGAVPSTTVTFIVPAAAGTGKVRLTTAAGTALSAAKLGVTRQSSSSNYSQLSSNATSATAAGAYSTPVATDLDKDGLLELLVGQGDGTMMDYEQTGANQAFSTTGTLITFATGGTVDVGLYAKPTVSDLDGDGLQEIIVGEETGKVYVYEQAASTGTDAFKMSPVSTLFANPYGATTSGTPNAGSYARPTVGDLDSDGLIDIVVGSNNGALVRYEQLASTSNTTAGFSAATTIKLADGTTVLDAGDVSKPLITDYDGDGKLDMLVGNYAGNVQFYTQTTANAYTFSFVRNLSADGTSATVINMGSSGTNPSSMGGYAAPAVTDYDGDGLLDLFIGNGTGTVYRYEQTQSAAVPTLTTPLPVVLTSFAGQAASTGNQLKWSTAQEIKSASFVVEASADGSTFAAIGELAAAGNSTTVRSYEFLDASATALSASRRYYRLRQVDLDGTTTYSPVVTLTRVSAAPATAVKSLDVYPNPFAETLTVALPSAAEPQAVALTLSTLAGRPVYATRFVLGAAPQALASLPELAAGVYVLRLTTATGIITQKVTRQ
ncbi:FG-GAP-like repeat-containing protein [Hymenobacter properus]|uniref:VCBS repeat-containing protein n=1 Tax=Hymenobacter properus TaxID=2791026 RepID=A0A931FKZ6_9BACT|nr:FG-GAP-like repeat-containing protein [Hymenobacter properus]MBF9142260.1 VCBS repeat-containing protein [Hymenobacter properus]MBR7721067.1 VCBS repeat-containing protein [Microvirga sp. SRT04]